MAQLFDPSEYLAANPDVARAVEEGRMPSAWRHYVQWGHGEGRPGVPDAVRKKVTAVLSASAKIPPTKLISRVHGNGDAAGFQQVGRTIALDIFNAVNARVSLDHPLRILDFGCGCARVLRFMGTLAPESTFHASDIDGEAIEWCRANYPVEVKRGRYVFVQNEDLPPAPFREDYFDLIYGISVFTHLPEDLQLQWLSELRRIARPGGLLVLSTQGDALIRSHLDTAGIRGLDEHGFYYHGYGSTEGLPEYYQAAWHTRRYIDRVWTKFFHVAEHVHAGIGDHQDLVLCVKRTPPVI
jgi:SAM-dependent methyltransferase